MRRFRFISSLDLTYIAFISAVFCILSGILKYTVTGSLIMFMLTFFAFYLLYGIWYLIYKLGMFVYKKKIKNIIDDFKKTKEKVQKES